MKLLDCGQTKIKSNTKQPKEGIEGIISQNKMITNEEVLSTPESLPINNQKIFQDKLKNLKVNIQTTKSSKILEVGLISKEKGLKPFWNPSLTTKSKKLWLPQQTDLQDLGSTYSNLFLKNTNANLKFYQTKKMTQLKPFQMISAQSLQYLAPDTMDNEVIKTRKVRVYPNKKQQIEFKKYFDTSRYIYNQCVEYYSTENETLLKKYNDIKKDGCVYKNKTNTNRCKKTLEGEGFFCKTHKYYIHTFELTTSFITMRKTIMKSDKDLLSNEEWLKDTPYDTRQLMIKSFCGNLKSVITNQIKGNIESFDFEKKKENKKLFHISKNALDGDLQIFKRRLKTNSKLKKKKNNKKQNYKIECDCSMEKIGSKYFLLIPIKSDRLNTKATYDTISLDPGVRVFQTGYSPDGLIMDFNMNRNKLEEKEKYHNNLTKVNLNKISGKTKRHIKNKTSLLRTKMRNKITDFQWKLANYLVKDFNTIIIPKFQVSKMVKKENRNIGKITVKKMLELSHNKFLEKLKVKCIEYNRVLIICTEEYTSKTCGKCGIINKTLGGKKIFKCETCNLVIDRDVNGARNILLKCWDVMQSLN